MRPRVYLAGPDVFLPDPARRAAALKAACAEAGLEGVSPLDALADEPADWAALPEWRRLHLRNEAHIRGCDALIANLTPFRSPSADAGTVYELGFMRALGRPVFGFTTSDAPFTRRTLAMLGTAARREPDGSWTDGDGLLVESFGLTDNLMIDGGIAAAGGTLVVGSVPAAARWTDMAVFRQCVGHAARVLAAGQELARK